MECRVTSREVMKSQNKLIKKETSLWTWFHFNLNGLWHTLGRKRVFSSIILLSQPSTGLGIAGPWCKREMSHWLIFDLNAFYWKILKDQDNQRAESFISRAAIFSLGDLYTAPPLSSIVFIVSKRKRLHQPHGIVLRLIKITDLKEHCANIHPSPLLRISHSLTV